MFENKKLDRKYGTIEEQRVRMSTAENGKIEGEQHGMENYGPMYRYVL